MKHAVRSVLFASLLVSPAALAQTRPDFSGTWTMDPSRSALAVQNEPVRSRTVVIRQTPTELSIETRREEKSDVVVYKPGSADSLNAGSSRSPLLASVWYWDGPKLITETIRDVNGATVRTREVHSLEAGGQEMIVETLLVVEHGYTLRGAQNYGSGKDIYKKVGS